MTDSIAALPIPLERDVFCRTLLRELSGTLEEVVGLDEAAGFISVVGTRVGEMIGAEYRAALGQEQLDAGTVAAVLVDLKRRIEGDFFLIEATDEKLVLGNRACPFAEKVIGRPSLCMMTSNVFGRIAADNLGYARVVLEETIAQGAPGCRVGGASGAERCCGSGAGPELLSRRRGVTMPALRAFLAVAGGLREAMLLVDPAGVIRAANPAARVLLAPLAEGAALADALAEGAGRLPDYLRRCSGSAQPLPGGVMLRGEPAPRPFRCEGSVYRPDETAPAMLLLLLRPRVIAAPSFPALTRQVEALNAEVAARAQAVAAMGQALEARDGLLRELHHRVRNTIQLFMALLQASSGGQGLTAESARRLGEQFQAVGFVQKQMSTVTDLRRIALLPLLEELAEFLRPPPPAAGFRISGAAAELPLEQATPLAILLARCLGGGGGVASAPRHVEVVAEGAGLAIRIDQPGPAEACQAILAEELSQLLAHQIDATLSCIRAEGLWRLVITLPPG